MIILNLCRNYKIDKKLSAYCLNFQIPVQIDFYLT